MKFWFGTPGWGWRLWGVSNGDKWFIGLSVKQGASHDSENVAEVEALREEVERVTCELMDAITRADKLEEELREAREFRDKMANAIGNDQLRRFIEKHGEPVPLITRMQAAEARAERLEAEVERLRAEVARLEVIAGYGGVSSDAPERLILASEVYDGIQSCDKWCDVRRVVDDGQPMPESATAYVRADRAERLAEALEDIRSRSSIDLAMRSDQFELTAMLGDIHQIAGAALAQEDDQ